MFIVRQLHSGRNQHPGARAGKVMHRECDASRTSGRFARRFPDSFGRSVWDAAHVMMRAGRPAVGPYVHTAADRPGTHTLAFIPTRQAGQQARAEGRTRLTYGLSLLYLETRPKTSLALLGCTQRTQRTHALPEPWPLCSPGRRPLRIAQNIAASPGQASRRPVRRHTTEVRSSHRKHNTPPRSIWLPLPPSVSFLQRDDIGLSLLERRKQGRLAQQPTFTSFTDSHGPHDRSSTISS